MKKYLIKSFGISFLLILHGCSAEEEDKFDWFCGDETGIFVENELGKIYQMEWYGGKQYYYIGDVNEEGGGHVPCEGFLGYKSLVREGLTVSYSGYLREPIDVTPDGDPIDPIYGGIELTSLELLDIY